MKKNFLSFLLFLSLILIFIGFLWYGIYSPKDVNSQIEEIFIIKTGEGTKEISFNLEKQGFIKSGPFFRFYTLYKGISGDLQAGEYLLSPSMAVPEITEKFVSGKVIKKEITIIEGWNLRDIGSYLENRGMFQAEELFEIVGFPLIDYSKTTDLPKPEDFSIEFSFLRDKPKNLGLEGYLFPDTYQTQKGESLESIIRKMFNNFDKKLTPDLRNEISRQKKSIFEIITMASLIEKEVRTFEDKKLVSGVLWKRLKAGIPLQVDATIAYITGKKTTRISKEETKIDSPYNAYKYPGLPLGPICNPGLESIEAALYPKDSDFWYYLSTPEGQTIFSRTLEEHNIAKAKFLK
ncbi:MAG TPA: endolytic transglycosylase MltG [Candidatus Nealsonbacteria bacterium]|uniref:Endolytic murein transglycosylase n=1 Tax=marine sediment metagenome TaxID=412755 RepID=A0A0F9U7P0_9ZZZZ|nr:endolytic transglycosylase MltG [Candidatus Nealsonbacteria bacterium]HEB46592.1 endolytic transglycosylase MltG [Candidatus Nealsonbacteria bacterium]